MKELTNEEIERLAGMVSEECKPVAFARLIAGDLSHIGRGILEGRKVAIGGRGEYYDPNYWEYNMTSDKYSLEPIKEYHHGTEPIKGLKNLRKWVIQDKCVVMEFSTKKQADKFANGLVKKEVE